MSKGVKKVLFTSHTANFSKFNRPFMRLLKEQGYEVHYASMGEEEVKDCDKHFTIPFERSPFKFNNLRAIRQLKKIIDTEDYDLIHTHTPMGSVVTRLAAKQARERDTHVIYTAHGFHFFKGAPILNWLVYYPIEKWMSRYTDIIITINNEDLTRASKFHAKSVHKINGVGIDLTRFKPIDKKRKNTLRKEYDFQVDDFILVIVAELNANKNQRFIIENINSLSRSIPSLRLILCGSGELEERYNSLIAECGLKDKVSLMGYREDLENLLAISDICVASSIREGFGLNLVEAMAIGLPIVASHNRGHSEIICNGVNGYLYDLNNTEEFSKRITDFFMNPKEYKRISEVNKRDAMQYSLDNSIKNMARIYRKARWQ